LSAEQSLYANSEAAASSGYSMDLQIQQRVEETRRQLSELEREEGREKEIAVARERIGELQGNRAKTAARAGAANSLARILKERLGRASVSIIEAHRRNALAFTAAPKMPSDISTESALRKRLAAVGEKLAELRADRNQVSKAWPPRALVKKQAIEYVDALAARSMPNFGRVVMGLEQMPYFPGMRLDDGDARIPHAWGVQAIFNREATIKLFHKLIDENADDTRSLSDEQRTAKLAALDSETLAQSRLYEAMLGYGITELNLEDLPFRIDCDVRAMLSLSDDTPVRKYRGPENQNFED
jgi:hypothetical protein